MTNLTLFVILDFFLGDVQYLQYIRNFKAFKKFSVEFENVKHDVNKRQLKLIQ